MLWEREGQTRLHRLVKEPLLNVRHVNSLFYVVAVSYMEDDRWLRKGKSITGSVEGDTASAKDARYT